MHVPKSKIYLTSVINDRNDWDGRLEKKDGTIHNVFWIFLNISRVNPGRILKVTRVVPWSQKKPSAGLFLS